MTKTGLRTASPWIDLHMHSIVSDGTDRPEELLQKAKDAGLKIFSVTDHDSVNACSIVQTHLKPGDPCFINGAEFSCRDEEGKYHILAYGFDHESDAIEKVVRAGHTLRMNKVQRRIDFLKSDFGMEFPEADLAELFSFDNPGKPHIALMMVKNGFAESKEDAIRNYIDKLHLKGVYLGPEEVIRGILDADGIPVCVKQDRLPEVLQKLEGSARPRLVITDSQVFAEVAKAVPDDIPLTSFSILMARYKGFLASALEGVKKIDELRDGDIILISEGCTHHRQCGDIGTEKIPNWIRQKTGADIRFETSSGLGFPEDLSRYALVIHCGACMLGDREVRYRMKCAADQGIPFTNYGTAIAHMKGILERSTEIVRNGQD